MRKTIFTILIPLTLLTIGCSSLRNDAVRKPNGFRNDEGAGAMESEFAGPIPRLDAPTRNVIQSYGPTIKHYSRTYGFDWRLMLALIKVESNFRDAAESHCGAAGLMQVMPHTQQEIAKRLAIDDIAHPKNNIRAGIFYIRKLYRMFDGIDETNRIRLTLAAYNAGPGRVLEAQKLAKYLSDDPARWQSVKDALPLLSERYRTLHQNIWPSRKPRAFNNYGETISHVEKVMAYYDEYRLVLN